MQVCGGPETDLAVMPPGPGLAAALASVELSRVPNDRMLELLRAQYRQLCHEQARMAAVLAEVGRCAGFPEPRQIRRLASPDRFAAQESRAALWWSRRAAEDEHDLAEAVVSEWPAVFAAWLAGDIDRPRVRVFERYLTGLTGAQVTAICRVAVPRASRSTTGQLAVLLRRMVIAVDPEAAARWYRDGVRRRGVVAYPAPDGTITLSANGLPAPEAEAACVRLQDLAAAAKRAGHPGLIDQIRCDLFLGLLDGRFHHMSSDELIATLIAGHHADASRAEDEHAPAATPEPTSGGHASGADRPPGDAPPSGDDLPSGDVQPNPGRDQRVGIEIRVGLATLLGRDEHPAEIPGLGLLLAPDARRSVGMQGRAEWRFALTDTEGRLVFDGLTRRRPHGIHRDGPPGGIVELHLPLELLTELQADGRPAHGDWAMLIADIAAQYGRRDDLRRDLDAAPDSRLPRAALRRHTEIRDRTCIFVGCRRRAHAAQQDHSRDYQHGGTTVRTNLGPLCSHDHQVKHLGGWRVEQPCPGSFVWRSPLGGVYPTAGEPFLPPMPEPAPADPAQATPAPADPAPAARAPADLAPADLTVPILSSPSPRYPPRRLFHARVPRGDPDDPPPF